MSGLLIDACIFGCIAGVVYLALRLFASDMQEQQVMVVTAADLSRLFRGESGEVAFNIVEPLARLKQQGHRALVLRVEFPGEPEGGLTLAVRSPSWLSNLTWRLAGPALAMWRG